MGSADPRAPKQLYISLGIGEIVISDQPAVVSTVLGSCISVCIYSIHGTIGGINHFVLPKDPMAKAAAADYLRYGNTSTRTLIETILETPGVLARDLRAKIIGGASIRGPGLVSGEIGEHNQNMAKKLLSEFGIKIVASDVGGRQGRKIFFYTASGKLRVSPVGEISEKAILKIAPTPLASKALPEKKPKRKRVLIVDDSKTVREMLKLVFGQDPELEVAAMAASAREADAILKSQAIDVMTLDIHMPEMDGIAYLTKLMSTRPMPVVMLTALSMEDGGEVLRALELGAVDYIQKPRMAELPLLAPQICEKIKAAASAHIRAGRISESRTRAVKCTQRTSGRPLVAIGASTGGTQALQEVLLQLSPDIPPIVIVQHIPPVFSKAYADRLNSICPFEVKEAADGDQVLAGRVLIAPGAMQMRIVQDGYGFRVKVEDGPPVNRHKPSVDVLFDSVAKLAKGKAIGIILTGMGADGARGMKAMKEQGCQTIAQDEKSSVVFGMPREAIQLGAVDHICDLSDIAKKLESLLSGTKSR